MKTTKVERDWQGDTRKPNPEIGLDSGRHSITDSDVDEYNEPEPALQKGVFSFLNEHPHMLQKKWEDHIALSSVMFVVAAFFGPSEWIADYVTDPLGAQHTISLRLSFFSLAVFPLLFKIIKNRRLLELMISFGGLIGLINFIEILNRLHNGMIYDIGGFTFFLFLPLLMGQGFSVKVNIASTFLYTAFPHFYALMGFAPHFPHIQYAVLIWPAAIATMLAHYAFAFNYRSRYDSERQLKLASNTDSMTGVSNRRYFLPLLQQEISRSRRLMHPMSLMILDIDHFKQVNDNHGHPTGDHVICTLANICKKTARQIDTVARLGGEEFAILLLEVRFKEALLIAERIRHAVQSTPMLSLTGEPLLFTVSIGVAEQPLYNESAEKLVALADAALYQAKASGRNCVMGATLAGISPIQTILSTFEHEHEC